MDILGIQRNINKLNYTNTLAEDGLEGPYTKKAMAIYEEIFKKPCNMVTTTKTLKTKMESILPVPYVTQRDGYIYSNKMCNLACTMMLFKHYNIDRFKTIAELDYFVDNDNEISNLAIANSLFNYKNAKKLEQISLVLAHLLTKFIGKTFETQYVTQSKMKELLGSNHPVILATKLTGYVSKNANAGHYVVLTGFFEDVYIINDPWGIYVNYSSPDNTTKGEQVIIPKEILFGEYGVKTAYDEVKPTEINKNRFRVVSVKI